MCALMTPIIKSDYKLYPGMPVVKKSHPAKLPSNNNLIVPKRERARSTSLRSNISAQSNPEFSIASTSPPLLHSHGSSSASSMSMSIKRQRNSASLSKITNKDDVRRKKLHDILEEKERQRKISNSSSNNGDTTSTNKNPFAKLLKHFGIHKQRKTCDNGGPPIQEVQS